MKQIPKIILELATEYGFNSVRNVGEYNGRTLYGCGYAANEAIVPLGPPSFILWNGTEWTLYSDADFKITDSL